MLASKRRKITVLLITVALIWGVYLFEIVFQIDLSSYGIRPRVASGLMGIVFAPFLHGSFFHLLSNTVPLLVLCTLMIVFYEEETLEVVLTVALLGGALTWLLALGDGIHIGASGVIFGLAGFIVCAGILTRRLVALLLGVVILLGYGLPLLWGLVPIREQVSYSGHWYGLFAGIAIAFLYAKTLRLKRDI